MELDIRGLMKIDSLYGSELVAGSEGIYNSVSGVTVLEVSNLDQTGISLLSINKGEVVLTSCNDIKDDVDKQIFLINALSKRGASGIILFYVGRVIKSLDKRVISLCNELSFPLICPNDMVNNKLEYSAVIKDVTRLLLQKSEFQTKKERDILKGLMELSQQQKSFYEGVKYVGERCLVSVVIMDQNLEPIVDFGDNVDSLRKIIMSNFEDTLSRNKMYSFYENSTTYVCKYIKVHENHVFVGFCGENFIFEHRNFIMQILEMLVDLWIKDINRKSEKELIRVIIKKEESNIQELTQCQRVCLDDVSGFLLIDDSENQYEFRKIKNELEKQFKFSEVRIVSGIYKKIIIFMFVGKSDIKGVDSYDIFKDQLQLESGKIKNYIFYNINSGEELLYALPKVINIYPKLKSIYENKIIGKSEIQMFINLELISKTDLYITYKWMLEKLYEYDIKNKSNLMKTLIKAFLEYSMNLKQMAKCEFIHYNTIQYRMKKIEEILQMDMKKSSDISVLYIIALIAKKRIMEM